MNPMTIGSHGATAYAAGTSAFGGALAIVLTWGLSVNGLAVPDYVTVAFGVVFTGLCSFVLRYVPQPKENT